MIRPETINKAVVARLLRFRLANLRKRYHADGGQASTGSSVQVTPQVGRQAVRRLVPPGAVLLQRLHHDPVQLAPHQTRSASAARSCRQAAIRSAVPRSSTEPHARPRRLLLADDPQHFVRIAPCCSRLAIERSRAGQKLVEEHAQAVDVAASVDVEPDSAPPARGSCTAAYRRPRRTRCRASARSVAGRSPWQRRSR